MKSFLVIGLGRFGRHLAEKLMELGNEVMVIDQDEGAGSPAGACGNGGVRGRLPG